MDVKTISLQASTESVKAEKLLDYYILQHNTSCTASQTMLNGRDSNHCIFIVLRYHVVDRFSLSGVDYRIHRLPCREIVPQALITI